MDIEAAMEKAVTFFKLPLIVDLDLPSLFPLLQAILQHVKYYVMGVLRRCRNSVGCAYVALLLRLCVYYS